MGKCKDCYWWDKPYEALGDDPILAECNHRIVRRLFGYEYPPATPPDFGCCWWKVWQVNWSKEALEGLKKLYTAYQESECAYKLEPRNSDNG